MPTETCLQHKDILEKALGAERDTTRPVLDILKDLAKETGLHVYTLRRYARQLGLDAVNEPSQHLARAAKRREQIAEVFNTFAEARNDDVDAFFKQAVTVTGLSEDAVRLRAYEMGFTRDGQLILPAPAESAKPKTRTTLATHMPFRKSDEADARLYAEAAGISMESIGVASKRPMRTIRRATPCPEWELQVEELKLR